MGTEKGTFDAKKARLSVPSAFRDVLTEQSAHEIILRPSNHSPCIDVWARPAYEADVKARIGEQDRFRRRFDETTDELTIDVFKLRLDAEGRIVLPQDLLEQVPLEADLRFLGREAFFQIWSTRVWTEERARRRERARLRQEAEDAS